MDNVTKEIEKAYTVIYHIQYLQTMAKLTECSKPNELYLSEYAYILDDFINKLHNSIAKIEKISQSN